MTNNEQVSDGRLDIEGLIALARNGEFHALRQHLHALRASSPGEVEPVGEVEIVEMRKGTRGVSHIKPDNWWFDLPAGTHKLYASPAAGMVTDEMRGFMFALLGADTWIEAGAIWEGNPEQRKAAHAFFGGEKS